MKKLFFTAFMFAHAFLQSVSVVTVKDFIKLDETISYQKCHDASSFYYKIPQAWTGFARSGKVEVGETFVLSIPQAKACAKYCLLPIQDKILRELCPYYYPLGWYKYIFDQLNFENQQVKKIDGTVAAVTCIDEDEYCHFMLDTLARFAMLDMQGFEYDWVYMSYNRKYLRDILGLLGVDENKIIEPYGDTFCIQADTLLVPSLAVHTVKKYFSLLAVHTQKWHVDWLRSKFLPMVANELESNFSKRVFISRKKAQHRKMINEDEVFKLFKAYGFERYVLEDMTFLQQVALFKQAEIVVGAHGAGLTNIVFCDPGTRIIEIFQKRLDATFYCLSQLNHLKYDSIFTQKITMKNDDTVVPLSIIQQYLGQAR